MAFNKLFNTYIQNLQRNKNMGINNKTKLPLPSTMVKIDNLAPEMV
jgi:hypothetical protein